MRVGNQDKKHAVCVGPAACWVREFCAVTAQQGYKYIAMPGQHWAERLLWVAVVLVSLVMALYEVSVALNNNFSNSTINVVESTHYNIWNVPFPAVTICSINRLSRSVATQLADTMFLPSGTTREEIFEDLSLLMELVQPSYTELTPNLTRLQAALDNNKLSIEEVMQQMAPACEDTLVTCMWKGRLAQSCRKLFRPVKTIEGFCCTFNYKGLSNEELSRGLSEDHLPSQHALRVSAIGHHMGLSVVLSDAREDYFSSMLASYGYKVVIHNAYNYPDSNVEEEIVAAGSETFLDVSPTEIYSTDDVREIAVERRHCRFVDEATSKTMKYYTYNNCIMECQLDMTVKLCGCAPFYLPNKGERICNLTDVPCLALNTHILTTLDAETGTEDGMAEKEFQHERNPCDCVPGCLQLYYRVHTTAATFSPGSALTNQEFYGGVTSTNTTTVLHVLFVDLVGTRFRNGVFLTWLDLVARLGGLLGLLLGFSLASAFEMVYFFTIRVFFHVLGGSHVGPRQIEDPVEKVEVHFIKIARGRNVAWDMQSSRA